MELDGTTLTGHYIQVDAGENVLLDNFDIKYEVRNVSQGIQSAKILTSLTGEDETWNVIYAINNNSVDYNINSNEIQPNNNLGI